MIESETREDEKQYAGKGGQKAGSDDAAPEVLIKLKRKSTCSLPDPSTAREKLKKVSPPEALLRELLV